MNYQLIIQFEAESLDDFDHLVALEEKIASLVGDSADVDGHDFDSGTGNIFINTQEPKNTFQELKPFFEKSERLDSIRVGYRHENEDVYTLIWPEESHGVFKL